MVTPEIPASQNAFKRGYNPRASGLGVIHGLI